jgi:hypothetical protein
VVATTVRRARAIALAEDRIAAIGTSRTIEMIEQVRRQVSGTQVRGSFRCAVTGPHVSDRKCKPRTTVGSAANQRIHRAGAGR